MDERTKSKITLFFMNVLFATAFIATKGIMEIFPMYMLTALRFVIAFLFLACVQYKKLKSINVTVVLYGFILSVFYIVGVVLQTLGVKYTDAGRTSFLGAFYCLLMPFLEWAVLKIKPTFSKFLAAIIGVIGVGFVALTSNFTISGGDAFSILASVSFAFYLLFAGLFAKKADTDLFTLFCFLFSALACLIYSFITEKIPAGVGITPYLGIVYLAIVCSGIPLTIQNKCLKHIEPFYATLMCGVQAMFATIFSVIIFKEQITPRCLFGFILILVALFCTEIRFSFKK